MGCTHRLFILPLRGLGFLGSENNKKLLPFFQREVASLPVKEEKTEGFHMYEG